MPNVFADRVQETTATTGTGTLSLAGAVTQYQSFSAGIGNGNTCDYCLLSGNGTDWETGSGTYTSSGSTLSRDTVYASSNSGSKISLTGTSTVFGSLVAKRFPVCAPPQGRLTLTSNTPVMTADVTGATTIYYDSHVGNLVPVGGFPLAIPGDQISMGLDAGVPHVAANAIYDIFGINNSGALVLAIGPAWLNTATITVTIATPAVVSWTGHGLPEGAPVVFTTTGALPTGITAGTTYFVGRSPGANSFNISTSVANAAAGTFVATSGTQSGTHTGTNNTTIRGTGAGTTELQLSNGVWTNKNSLTHAWGGASGTTDYGAISANAATYLGSLYATAAGQTGMQFQPASAAGGSNAVLGLYNAYNRTLSVCLSRDSTASWTYASPWGWRAANGNVANRVTYLDGLAQSTAKGTYFAVAQPNGSATTVLQVGVNFNATTSTGPPTGGQFDANTAIFECTITAYNYLIGLGLNYCQAMEQGALATGKWFAGTFQQGLFLELMN